MARLLRRLLSGVDALVSRVENHEGQVECALGDERERLLRAERELDRVRARAAGLDQAWRSAVEQQAKWRERARSGTDQTLALDFLRLSKRAGARAAELAEDGHELAELQRRLEALVLKLGQRLGALEQQRERMQVRQCDIAFGSSERGVLLNAGSDAQALLSRWEASVADPRRQLDWLAREEAERVVEPTPDDDEAFLRLELEELRRESQ